MLQTNIKFLMTKFGKMAVSSVVIILILLAVSIYYFDSKKMVVEKVSATSFEECAAQGNPIMESYPEQCIDAVGNHFTHIISTSTEATTTDVSDLIKINFPKANATVTSPLVVKGQARGGWFFEGSFPVTLTDWDGKIIANSNAEANGDWMTADFVPFTATLTFKLATTSYSSKGTLILKNDNPSGLPENDKSKEIQVILK